MKIVFTGGGSGGHVIPNIAIIKELEKEFSKNKNEKLEILYIGSKNGIEKNLVMDLGIDYREISTGKLRRYRYLSKDNIKDIFNVFKGIKEAKNIIKKEKPDVVFSKGGFVSVPVVLGAHSAKVPTIIHESDMTPGLANKISIPFAKKICVTFPETLDMVKKGKGILTGSPVREEILKGDKEKGLKFLGFDNKKKIILVIGGSQGSVALNRAIKENADELLKKYQIVIICGEGKRDESLDSKKGLKQFEYLKGELADVFACSDYVVSRAGAGMIYELLALAKPNVLIPLSKKASRGDQILNANSFENQGFSIVLDEDTLDSKKLLDGIQKLENEHEGMIKKMKATTLNKATQEIVKIIINESKYQKNNKK